MPKNLLAVDDSTTMRKVLEITFSGEDFQVQSAGDRAGCMAKLAENPSVVVIDTSLEGDDGYAICREVRGKLPRAVIVMMASRYNPYDAGKGKEAGADDYVDKPFDTQQMIDKIKKLVAAKESAPMEAAAPPPPPAPAPIRAPAPSPAAPPVAARPIASPPSPPVAPPPAPKPFTPGAAPARSGTLMFSVDGPPMPAPAATSSTAQTAAPPAAPLPPPPRPVEREAPTAAPAAPPPPAPAAAPAPNAAASAVNGHMGPKLAAMGLSPAQADAVMALSREVVERVVWEVVPQLAEAIIKEEIQRLTKEG